jgi:hypothetical protein
MLILMLDVIWFAGDIMPNERADFLELCRALDEGAQTDLSDADRELLIVLHKALSGLKTAVERALLNAPSEGQITN